ncbi:hypothetical protein EO98_01350 [Methanosarcina sp. 2.H.T.1A.6]|uniref:glycosyltransferase n=1 Tax=unclassified Methanosarcina TaxID=2644672 RepID=UPI000621BA7F|nr:MULTISPECIES: glycosyltransferase [unclassified Methanosarcina]KKG14918.1 hypothetical protein EO94_13415 [Methanosarcina sp. 2.H.T.1A.3]KKG21044.1 hypothetical protein EO98_01350 [Methanosarcina sp. 2.H.T.1A.6]KKG21229.1 hypothetical protein EO97_01835 [Methanosarcina sp. 2.H.T.1A.15]KKG27293.1 hypothetical protein EO96_10185 [Methanosarcina sp. 2.H.T.1A.8]
MDCKKILIYSPHTGGHRQVYCNVIADWALDSGMEVLLYVGSDWCNSENSSGKISPYIEVYKNNPNVSIINCDIYKNNHNISLINLAQNPFLVSDSRHLIDMENKLNPDLVFVIAGDEFNHSPYSILKNLAGVKKHSSKWIAIFISPYCYPSDNWSKRNILKIALKQKVKHFDIIYWLDEYFVNHAAIKNSFWLPDISKSFNYNEIHTDKETESLCSRIDNFLSNNKGKEVLLFFGSYFNRKGFDFLLELALNDKQFVILRAGDTSESDRSPYFADKMITLENNGQLLNIPKFVESPVVIEKLFNVTNFIPLPYRNHYSSSGVMLQAMEFGKPVIVPDVGLMGGRVTHNNIGITYKHENYEEFKNAVYRMQKSYDKYIPEIQNFYMQFSKENIFEHLNIMVKNDRE